MAYKIIGDSCTDITEEMKKEGMVSLVPLTLSIEGEEFVDDETFNQQEFIAKMKASPECPKSACPSPERYMQEFEGQEECYVVTLSSRLSGSYNSAVVAKEMYLEEHPDAKIEIVDSRSASCGQMLIAVKLKELKEKGLDFATVKEKITEFRDNMETKFVLESLENLRKNGRLSRVTFAICNVLNIRPVMAADDGEIICNHLQPKNLLDLMRNICKKHPNPDTELCKLFNTETQDGRNMGRYSELLEHAISSIINFCNIGRSSIGASTPKSPRATIIPSETLTISDKLSIPVVLSILEIIFKSSLLHCFKISLASKTSSLVETKDKAKKSPSFSQA